MNFLVPFFMCNLVQCLTTRFSTFFTSCIQKIKKCETASIDISMVKANSKDRDAVVKKFVEKAKDKYCFSILELFA